VYSWKSTDAPMCSLDQLMPSSGSLFKNDVLTKIFPKAQLCIAMNKFQAAEATQL
jgi:hypothetical protein